MASLWEVFSGKRFVCCILTVLHSIHNTVGRSIASRFLKLNYTAHSSLSSSLAVLIPLVWIWTGLSCISEEDVLLREALKQAKPILCSRLPIELLPLVLEGKGVISADERQFINREPSSTGKKLMLLEQMESKSISGIRQFLDILKSDKSLQGYGYLADMVESDCAMLVREKKEPTTGSK